MSIALFLIALLSYSFVIFQLGQSFATKNVQKFLADMQKDADRAIIHLIEAQKTASDAIAKHESGNLLQ